MERKWVLCCDSGTTNPSLQGCDVKTRNKTLPLQFLVLSTYSSFWEVLARESPCVFFSCPESSSADTSTDHLSLLSITKLRAGSPESLCHTPSDFSAGSHQLCPVEVEAWVATKEKTGSTSGFLRYILWFTLSFMTGLFQLIFLSRLLSDANIPVSTYPLPSITDFSLFTFHDIYSRYRLLFNYSFWGLVAVDFYLVSSWFKQWN